MADQDPRALVDSIMKDTRIATLTYVDDTGRLVSLPMSTQNVDDPGHVWLIADLKGESVASIRKRPAVNVAYSSDDGWVSLAGTARVSQDRERLDQLWYESILAFMSRDDTAPGLLEISVDAAEYRERPCEAATVVQFVKAVVSDD